MKNKILILFIFLGLSLILVFFLSSQSIFFQNNPPSLLNSGNFSLLFLGKPGPGYIGSENTDSIMVLYYSQKNNKVFLIPIPRDLIVKDENGNLEKINALYEKKKISLLLKKAEEFTGLRIKNYLAVDLKLITSLVDFLGGLEVDLDEPVTDAVTLYTIPSGRQKLNGDLIELVLRSRYHPEGDFFRQKNQIKVVIALKNKINSLNTEEKLSLMKFLENNKHLYQTNMSKQELLSLVMEIKDIKNLEIEPIILSTKNGLLSSGYFNIYNTEDVYGIYPSSGIDNYDKIRFYFQSKIK
jgi:polyisoprenyl-teichoic acid--peptidoglycan teichoic acid transferase